MCSCGKNTPPVGTNARAKNVQQTQAERAAAERKARQDNPSTTRIGAAAGVTQTFSLGDVTFGSALERDAYLARNGH